jgi:hypothetical protein
MKKYNNPEFQLHQNCVQYLKLKYENRGLCFSHHSPNETISIIDKKVMFQQNKFTLMGRKLGFPDLMILCKGKILFIEFKSLSGKLSENQKEVINSLEKQGFKTYIIRTFEEFKQILDKFLCNSLAVVK